MFAGRHDLDVVQGETFYAGFQLRDSARVPITLAGHWAVVCEIFIEPNVYLSTLGDSPKITTTIEPAGATGLVAVRIGADVTAEMFKPLELPTLTWRLQLRGASDATEVHTVLAGEVRLA